LFAVINLGDNFYFYNFMIRKILIFAGLLLWTGSALFSQGHDIRAFGIAGETKQLQKTISPLEEAVKEAFQKYPTGAAHNIFIPNTVFRLPVSHRQNNPIDESKVSYLTLDNAITKEIVRNQSPTLSMIVPLPSGETIELELFKKNPFSEGALVRTSDGDEFPIDGGAYYRGIIKNDPGSVAGLAFQDGEIIGVVASHKHGQFNIAKLEDFPDVHAIYSDDIFPPDINVGCQDAIEIPDSFHQQEQADAGSIRNNHSNKCVKVYIETNRALFTNKGSVNNVINYVNGIFNNVSIIYQNEEINTEISEIFVWTTQDPYPTNVGNALPAFRNNRPNYNGDVAHLFLLNGSGGGVAYLNVLCTSSAYAVSNINASYNNFPNYSWTIMVVTHEMGHNLGSQHTQWCGWPGGAIDNCYTTEGNCGPGPAPTNGGTVMSYCHLTSAGINLLNGFGPLPGNRIRTRVGQVNCLDTGCGDVCQGFNATANIVPTSCGLGNGSFQLNITGGEAPFQVNIGSGFTMQTSFQNLAAGTYNVLVVDANSCEVQISVVIPTSTGLDMNATVNATSCGLDNGSINFNIVQSNGAVTLNLGFGATQNLSFNNLQPGNYTLNASDNNGCTFTQTYNIGTSSPLQVFETTYPTSCGLNNGAVFFSTFGGSGTGNVWIDLNYNNNWQSNTFWEGLAAGFYHASLVDDANCTTEVEFEITNSEEISVEIVTNSTSCGLNNGSAEFIISGGAGAPYFVDFLNGSGPSSQGFFGNLSPGTYQVQVTDNGNCSSSSSFTIFESETVNLQTTTVLPTCGFSNGSINATISQTASSFNLNGNQQQSGLFENLPSGVYTLTATSTSGCSQTVTIDLITESVIDTELSVVNAYCGGTGSISVSVVQSGQYFYNIGQGPQTGSQFTGLQAGSYSITISDVNGCLDVVNASIEGSDAVTITSTVNNTTCGQANGSFTVNPTGGTAPYSFAYQGLSSTQATVADLPAGVYTVTVTDATGCEAVSNITVQSSNPVSAGVNTNNTTCGQQNGVINVTTSSGVGPFLYAIGNNINSTGTFSNLSAGEYTILVTDAAGCSTSVQTNVAGSQPLLASVIVQSPQCNNQNGSVTISATPSSPGVIFNLNGTESVSNVFENLGPGSYSLIVENEAGCRFEDVINLSNQWTPPFVDFTVIRNGLAIEIVNSSLGSLNNYQWSFGDGGTSTEANPIHEYASMGLYQICLEITNPCGTVSGCRSLNVVQLSECRFVDSLALVDLNRATKGEEWIIQWDFDEPVNLWHGVHFDGNGCIEAIILPDNNLQGHLPISIGNLSSIKRLDLSQNFIADTIPNEIRYINSLIELNLSHNQLSGKLDPLLADLVNLNVLQLQNNRLTDTVPNNLNKIRNLVWLDLSTNEFTGIMPSNLTQLTKLEWLSLANNHLHGAIPGNIGNLKELRNLYLNNNQLNGSIPSQLVGLDSLKALWLQHNKFSALPDLSTKTGFEDSPTYGFRIEHNYFTFEDVLPNINLFEGQEYSFYAPQAKVFRDTLIIVRAGEHVELDIEVDKSVEGVIYDWYRTNVFKYSTDVSVLEITEFAPVDQGIYVANISHPLAPDLILETYPVRIELDQSTSTQELSGINSISILPNPIPAGGWLRLEIESLEKTQWSYQIMDMSGKTLQRSGVIETLQGTTVETIQAPQIPGAFLVLLQCNKTGSIKTLKLITY